MVSGDSEFGIVLEAGTHPAQVPDRVEAIGASDVTVRPNAHFRGPVLARNLSFQGSPFSVAGPTVALGSLEAYTGGGELSSLTGPVMARASILVRSEGQASPGLRIVGDVTADKINATGVLVLGNVFATDIKLTNSVVFGTIASAGDLSLDRVTSLSFRGRNVSIGEHVQILQSTAIIDEKAQFHGGPVRSLVYSAWFRDQAPDKYDVDDIALPLTSRDIKLQTLEDDEGNETKVGVLAPHDYLLDSQSVERTMQTNSELLALITVAVTSEPDLRTKAPDLIAARSFLTR